MKNTGYIYIISNKAWRNYFKVGISKDVEERLNSYQISSPYRDYNLEFYIYTENYKKIEKDIHNEYDANYEWIKCNDINLLIDSIKNNKDFKMKEQPLSSKERKLEEALLRIKKNYIDKNNIKTIYFSTLLSKCPKNLREGLIENKEVILEKLKINYATR